MMRDQLNKIEEKVDKLQEQVNNIDKHLAIYNQLLDLHIKATNDNRVRIAIVSDRIVPLEDHVKGLRLIQKIMIIGIPLLGAVVSLLISLKII